LCVSHTLSKSQAVTLNFPSRILSNALALHPRRRLGLCGSRIYIQICSPRYLNSISL